MAFGLDGNLCVAQGKGSDPHDEASAIFQFSGTPAKGGSPLKFLRPFVTPASSLGLSHLPASIQQRRPQYQNTNVVTAFQGPNSPSARKLMPNSRFLQGKHPQGKFTVFG